MHSHLTSHVPPTRRAPRPSLPSPAMASAGASPAAVPPAGIERGMADALAARDVAAGAAPVDPGSLEYASWLARLRRATP